VIRPRKYHSAPARFLCFGFTHLLVFIWLIGLGIRHTKVFRRIHRTWDIGFRLELQAQPTHPVKRAQQLCQHIMSPSNKKTHSKEKNLRIQLHAQPISRLRFTHHPQNQPLTSPFANLSNSLTLNPSNASSLLPHPHQRAETSNIYGIVPLKKDVLQDDTH